MLDGSSAYIACVRVFVCLCLRVFVYIVHACTFRMCRQTHDRVLAFRFQFKKLMNECAAFDKRIDFIRAFCVYFVVTVLLSGFFFRPYFFTLSLAQIFDALVVSVVVHAKWCTMIKFYSFKRVYITPLFGETIWKRSTLLTFCQ